MSLERLNVFLKTRYKCDCKYKFKYKRENKREINDKFNKMKNNKQYKFKINVEMKCK